MCTFLLSCLAGFYQEGTEIMGYRLQSKPKASHWRDLTDTALALLCALEQRFVCSMWQRCTLTSSALHLCCTPAAKGTGAGHNNWRRLHAGQCRCRQDGHQSGIRGGVQSAGVARGDLQRCIGAVLVGPYGNRSLCRMRELGLCNMVILL